ncbi:hypothetical protein HPP92_022266 [Vanilla planifolia]|uniref:Uncharacterized protein n=1 Tax=Vanilla planifolia TaxID=51239 RepID=A0A835PT06_VANPL|nr:hypothetical protein HPP92_022266 [Vanilla planifolia]
MSRDEGPQGLGHPLRLRLLPFRRFVVAPAITDVTMEVAPAIDQMLVTFISYMYPKKFINSVSGK